MEPSLSISTRRLIVPRPKTYSSSSPTNQNLNRGLILMLVRYNSAGAHLTSPMIFKTRTPFDVALDMFLKAIVPIEDTEVSPIREARGRGLPARLWRRETNLTIGGQLRTVTRSLLKIH